MKINGNDALVNRTIVTLPRGTGDLTVTVRAVPLGWLRQFLALMPPVAPPQKPTGVVTNAGPKMEADWEDETFRKAFAERQDLSSFFMLYLVLKESPEIELVTRTVTTPDDLRTFRAEIEASGLSDGDVNILLDAIRSLSNLGSQEVAARRAGF